MRMQCEIYLEKTTLTAGEELKGEIWYTLSSELHVKNLLVLVYGKASKNKRLRPMRVLEENDLESPQIHCETVFSDKIPLLGEYAENRDNGNEELILPVGVSKIPVKIKIPNDAPSSFYYKYGMSIYSIVYAIEVYRYASYEKWRDALMIFDVIAPTNLDTIPLAQEPIPIDKELTHLCCCVPTGNVIINGNLPKTGYIAGTSIDFNLECSNQSYFGIENLQIFLRFELKYFPHGNEEDSNSKGFCIKIARINMEKVDFGSIQSGETRKFQRILHIPTIEPWNVEKCKIFAIRYVLLLKVKFPFPLPSLTEKFPIIIGNMSSSVNSNPSAPRQLMFLRTINDAEIFKLKLNLAEWNRRRQQPPPPPELESFL